jgi:hypothetical protein
MWEGLACHSIYLCREAILWHCIAADQKTQFVMFLFCLRDKLSKWLMILAASTGRGRAVIGGGMPVRSVFSSSCRGSDWRGAFPILAVATLRREAHDRCQLRHTPDSKVPY